MPASSTPIPDYLQLLSKLPLVAKGAPAYFRELRLSPDPFLAVGAWCALIDGRLITMSAWDELVAMCRYGAVRRKAFGFFNDMFESNYARKAAETPVASQSDLEQDAMFARLNFDPARAAEAEGALYLATGDLAHLYNAAGEAELAAGWQARLTWALRAVAIAPLSPEPVQNLYIAIESSGQPEVLEAIANTFLRNNMYLQISQIFLACAAMMRGDATLCLNKIKALDDAKISANFALKPFLGAVRQLRAQAEDKLGHYQKAYELYRVLNEGDRDPKVKPEHFFKGMDVRGKLAIPPLPPDNHPDVVQMLGFPRSGTTLLENALNSHPLVETFEEIPALNVAIDRIERVVMGKVQPEMPEKTFTDARARYYHEIEIRRKKPGAKALIDKLPLRTADAAFISRLFPDWRYIFSIRHPYDAVLSCFKQRFGANPAMENFHTIEDASRLYDFTMTQWFNHHTMDDPKVKYVRYDELVTDFERVVTGVLEFVGVPWDDAVLEFSKGAEKRAVKTPSYLKVRQGLSIGVQSSWRNYGFVFHSPAAQPLRKWVEFFGYPTE